MATKQITKIYNFAVQSLLYRCFSEAVNVQGKSTQAVETCPQEEPLKEVLLTLGFEESELTDLRNERGVRWRLNLQSGKPFDSFCRGCWGVAVSHYWEDAKIERENFSDTTKLAIEICQQRRLPWDLRPRPGSLNRGRAAKWWRSVCVRAVRSPAP